MLNPFVNYNVEINPNTNQPTPSYKVDQHGVVSEVEPQPEQLEAVFGLPKENVPTRQEKRQIEREIIEEFITSGMAPNFEEFPNDFANFVKRRIEGESFSKLATELDISSGKIVELIDIMIHQIIYFYQEIHGMALKMNWLHKTVIIMLITIL
ncbi:hypothetical protein [Bacillus sonorensis]|uniref:hypothetical protein n=1 Tax=Bacillus sonorensis TaxID=119858 RepID=UPI00227E2EC7|nr:hypothetical protein [Bacillus sonorensis]MCY8032010.1 hypothetical protein [Bacillus sonorensis]MCY8270865.1 hypothetical protein [Bacillus sonorensis]MCY8565066.1 hypothetical protein [Bacillus sonorensis]MCY8607325.1 hypothetical protein [Bacillus sonorensis]MCZ0068994.1 hypothetical protein [Bacillus sonorensis]